MRPSPPPPGPLDEAVRRMAQGDRQGFRSFVEGVGPPVHAALVRLLGDEREVAEVFESALVECWAQARLYDRHRGTPPRWAMAVARSHALDRLTTRRREGRGSAPPASDLLDRLWSPAALEPLSEEALRALDLRLMQSPEGKAP